ncbi:CBS domain-containing protein [Desulfovibrio inopinatus]|uniref:CBS domain-containing protein n=1 Tax=Desulfovibrio inopinatus TaxID=102109 RepID=UPI00040FBA49|nr:response regulator [Desulfovibrio inopinatus]
MVEKIRVLMVDDEEQFRITTSKILERRGFETIMAVSGPEAIEKLSEHPDVVVLDVKMEGMDGHETLKAIKAKKPDLPVIMLTGHGALPSAKKSLKEGAFDYLNKPCDIDIFVSRIKDAYRVGHSLPDTEKNARDLMIPLADYPSISDSATVAEAVKILKENNERIVTTDAINDQGRRSLLVFNANKQLEGILTPQAILTALRPEYLSISMPSTAPKMYSMGYSAMFWTGLFTAQAKTLLGKSVQDIMSDAPPSVDAEANLMEVIQAMHESGKRRLAVKKNGDVIGLVREQEVFYELIKVLG